MSILLCSIRCFLCRWQENGQLLPMHHTEWLRRARNLSDQRLFLHAQLSKLSLLYNVTCFVSHPILALFGHGDFQRCQIGCSYFEDDCFCMFLAREYIPTPSCRQSLLFTSFDIPCPSPSIAVLIPDFVSNSFRVQNNIRRFF